MLKVSPLTWIIWCRNRRIVHTGAVYRFIVKKKAGFHGIRTSIPVKLTLISVSYRYKRYKILLYR